MAIQKQPVTIRFQGGIDSITDAKGVVPTQLLDLQNATFQRATSLVKRNGYADLDLTIEGTSGNKLSNLVGAATRGSELIVFDGHKAYSHREDISQWSDAGEVSCPTLVNRPIARTGTHQTQPDHATLGGITVVAWEDSRGGVWYSLVDAESGKIVVADTQLDSGGQSPRVISNSSHIQVLWANTAMRHVRCLAIDPLNVIAPISITELADGLDPANPSYDAEYANDAQNAGVLVWAIDSGGFSIGWIHPSGVLGSASTGLPPTAHFPDALTGPIAVCVEHTAIASIGVLFASTANAVVAYLLDVNFSVLTGPTTVLSASSALGRLTCAHDNQNLGSDGQIWWAAEVPDPFHAIGQLDTGSIFCGAYNGTITTDGSTRQLRGHCLASRAFYDNGDVYCHVVYPVKFFPYYATVRMNAASWGSRCVTTSRILPGLCAGALSRTTLPQVQPVNPDTHFLSRQHRTALGYRIQLASDASQLASSNFGEQGIKLSTLDFNDPDAFQCAPLGDGLYMASAVLQHYDGARWAEANFHAAPDTAAGSIVVTAGALGAFVDTGQHGYFAVYEEIDNQGELHVSAPSVEVTITLSSAGKVIVTLPTCRLTNKKNVRIGVFRSRANDASAFFRVTSLDSTATGDNGYVANDPTVNTISFTDAMTDAVLITKEPLYTNGGILGNDPAPCAGGPIVTAGNRLFWLDPDDPLIVRFSQELSDNDQALDESASLFLRVDPFGGDIASLGVLDGAVIPFKETAIFKFAGPGPNPDGSTSDGNAFSPASRITGDVGCASARSIVETPIGLMFRSAKGLMLLGRDQQTVATIGDNVYGYKDQNISRATLLPDRTHILFLTDDDTGRTLLFDYKHQQWSTFTNHIGQDAVVVDGVYHYLRSDGRVFRETPGQYADGTQHIPMLISTAWIKFSGYLQGWQKVLRAMVIGTYKSSHQLSMRYRIDYQDSWSSPILVNVDSTYTPSNYGDGNYGDGTYGGTDILNTVYQEQFHLNRRCQSIAFEFSDVEPTGTFGAAFELSELLLTGGMLGPKYMPGATRSQ